MEVRVLWLNIFSSTIYSNNFENLESNTIRIKRGKTMINTKVNHIKKLILLYLASFKGHIYSLMLGHPIIKIFDINCKYLATPKIQINWIKHNIGRIKCKIYGSSRRNMIGSTCGDIFRDYF